MHIYALNDNNVTFNTIIVALESPFDVYFTLCDMVHFGFNQWG